MSDRIPEDAKKAWKPDAVRCCWLWPKPPTPSATASWPGRRSRMTRPSRTTPASPWPRQGMSSCRRRSRQAGPDHRALRLRDQLHDYLDGSDAGSVPRPSTNCKRLLARANRAKRCHPQTRRPHPARACGCPRPPEHGLEAKAGEPIIHRANEDENLAPTEYSVLLPPEYSPAPAVNLGRSFPLSHDGGGLLGVHSVASSAIYRRETGIALEYRLLRIRGRLHVAHQRTRVAVELALRDARRRTQSMATSGVLRADKAARGIWALDWYCPPRPVLLVADFRTSFQIPIPISFPCQVGPLCVA